MHLRVLVVSGSHATTNIDCGDLPEDAVVQLYVLDPDVKRSYVHVINPAKPHRGIEDNLDELTRVAQEQTANSTSKFMDEITDWLDATADDWDKTRKTGAPVQANVGPTLRMVRKQIIEKHKRRFT